VAVATLILAGSGVAEGPGLKAADEPKPGKTRRKVETFRMLSGPGGHLGVVLDEVAADDVSRLKLAEERGARVEDVVEGSAAEKAGVKKDDVIVAFQGERVSSAAQLRRLVRETPPGRQVSIEVSRDGSLQRLSARLEEPKTRAFFGDRDFDFDLHVPDIVPPRPPRAPGAPGAPEPPEPPEAPHDFGWSERDIERHAREMERHAKDIARQAERHAREAARDAERGARDAERNVQRMVFRIGGPRRLGVSYLSLSDQLAKHYGVSGGALVSEVEPDGPAARAGLQAGDVVTKVDGKSIDDARDLGEAVADAEPGGAITLGVRRGGKDLEVKATLREPERRTVRRRGTI
jgi:membrane-associated protease RseP (regulator of RpoE activity)